MTVVEVARFHEGIATVVAQSLRVPFQPRPQPKPARSPAASPNCSLHVLQPRPANPLPAQACDSSSRPFQDRVNSGPCPQPSPRISGASSSPGHPVPPAGLP
uniref:Uncharacterized protein n=1 Tax=Ficus carica TaxID=3494 RepID=A0AA88EGS3_FICCA|nr:hypothetical protein TIFTF001_055030 [Ficus carica]GMN74702.1 hypothetical protein TIFTF001_055033 [Ficus carica]